MSLNAIITVIKIRRTENIRPTPKYGDVTINNISEECFTSLLLMFRNQIALNSHEKKIKSETSNI